MRVNGRAPDQLRPLDIVPRYLTHVEGSVLISAGNTRLLCATTITESVPDFLVGSGMGWITAEYSMLPRATTQRKQRERKSVDGRTIEIQRFIGRALRGLVDRPALGERTILVDCDVIQADGGTRTLAVTGSYIASTLALRQMERQGKFSRWPLISQIAAVSIGIVGDEILLDLDYKEDSSAKVDLNLVMNAHGEFIEIQGTGEQRGFSQAQLEAMISMGRKGLQELFAFQQKVLS